MKRTYKLKNKKVVFDIDEYLKDSLKIKRNEMPQINLDVLKENLAEIKKFISVIKMKVKVKDLYPTQNEIDINKILRMIEEETVIENNYKQFVCSKSMQIMDGHHRHLYILYCNPEEIVDVYVFDMETQELVDFLNSYKEILKKPKELHEKLLEDYGKQTPDAVPGMGEVDYGKPQTANSEGEMGSGDIPLKDKDKEKIKTLFHNTNNYLKALLKEDFEKNKKEFKIVFDKNVNIDWDVCEKLPIKRNFKIIDKPFKVKTMEGDMYGKKGDYLMKGPKGELYPCDRDIFQKTYKVIDGLSEE